MLYQNILSESAPYRLFVTGMGAFPAHRHADIEFGYCLCGEYTLLIDRCPYTVREGDLVLIGPMVPHEIQGARTPDCRVLTGILGPALLHEDFSLVSGSAPCPVYRKEVLSARPALVDALQEAAGLVTDPAPTARLLRLSTLYRIAAYLAEALPRATDEGRQDLRRVAGVEAALELIYYGYNTQITVAEAAAASGYGKSNFCKIFRSVTGESFHRALNRRRVRVACDLLLETDLPIAAVGAEVGLHEPKTFCRVFRELEGISPGEYRKKR